MTLTKTEAAAYFDQAADLIDRGHWLQLFLSDHSGGYCARGALFKVVTGLDFWPAATDALLVLDAERLLVQSLPEEVRVETHIFGHGVYTQLAQWNNAPGRTKEEVVNLFRQRAADLREEVASELYLDSDYRAAAVALADGELDESRQFLCTPVPTRELSDELVTAGV